MAPHREQARPNALSLADHHARMLEKDPEYAQEWERTRPKRELVQILIAQRKQAGLGLRQLAAKAGWKPSFVSRLESATGPFPNIDTITRYLKACGTGAVAGLVVADPENSGLHILGGVTLDQDQEPNRPGTAFERIGSPTVPYTATAEPEET